MKINVRQKQNVVVLDLEGNIDINASVLVETVGKVLDNKLSDIICNCGGVNLVDYVGISLIAVVYKNILNHQGSLRLCNVPCHVMKLFSIVGLDRVFYYHATEEEAFEALQKDKRIEHVSRQPLRRRFKRIPLKAAIEYKQKFVRGQQWHKGKIINLSAEGIFMTAEEIFTIGEVLVTRVYLLPQPGIIEVEARVAWTADKDIQAQDYPGMGIEFINISSQQQRQILEFVERHLSQLAP